MKRRGKRVRKRRRRSSRPLVSGRPLVLAACVLGIVLGTVWGREVMGVVRGGVQEVVDRVPAFFPSPTAKLPSGTGAMPRRGSVEGVLPQEPWQASMDEFDPADEGRGDAVPAGGDTLPRIAVVLDDFGPNPAVARAAAKLPFPVTMAVLPGYAFSREIADMAEEKGLEVLLHQPMEPQTAGSFPGPGTLYTWMSDAEIEKILGENLAELGDAVSGANNHMGSAFTADPRAMTAVLRELRRRGLYFLDSVTTPDTVGPEVARSLGMALAARAVFLDDSADAHSLNRRWHEALRRALAGHPTVIIGHGRWETIRFLQTADLAEAGVDFCALSDMIAEPVSRAALNGTGAAAARAGF